MSPHTVTSYDEDLKALETNISRMGGLAEQQLEAILTAISESDVERAEDTIEQDHAIDAMQRTIEDQAVQIIIRRQPVSVDLRDVVGAMRIAGDLERIGDMSKNIGKRIASFDEKALLAPVAKRLCAMGDEALLQLKKVLDAYSSRNTALALEVWKHDDAIDVLYNSIFRELLTYMMEDPRTIAYGAHLLFCAKNIERIGDHCTNIAESVTYIVTGQNLLNERPRADETSKP